jgi:hypothetical protein
MPESSRYSTDAQIPRLVTACQKTDDCVSEDQQGPGQNRAFVEQS